MVAERANEVRAKLPNDKLQILYEPEVDRPQRRKLHAPGCRFAFRLGGRERKYREATAEEIRKNARCSKC
jgi:hypothetical protein